jgi:predicted nucleic acid-binding protein
VSGTLVLDCEGLSKLVRRTPELTEWLAAAEAEDIRVVTSSITLVEARDPKTNQARFDYAVSRINIVPPTETVARHASKLLAAAGLHGHEYALDAIVAATALASPSPMTVLTSDSLPLSTACPPARRGCRPLEELPSPGVCRPTRCDPPPVPR